MESKFSHSIRDVWRQSTVWGTINSRENLKTGDVQLGFTDLLSTEQICCDSVEYTVSKFELKLNSSNEPTWKH